MSITFISLSKQNGPPVSWGMVPLIVPGPANVLGLQVATTVKAVTASPILPQPIPFINTVGEPVVIGA